MIPSRGHALLPTRWGFFAIAAGSAPTSTPAFASSTRAASFAARAIAGSLRTRSCAIEPSTSSASWVATLRRRRRRAAQQIAKPDAAAFLERDRDLPDRAVCGPSSATALTNGQPRKSLAEKRRSSASKVPRICSARRLVGRARLHEAAFQIGRDQRILGREMVVERALADADFGRDGIDADGANALQIEQPVGGLEDALLHRRFAGRGAMRRARYPFVLTAGPLL